MSSSAPMMGMRVAADGAITYDFDGHISAQGIDLPVAVNGELDPKRAIRWLRENGDPAVSMSATDFGGTADVTRLLFRVESETGLYASALALRTADSEGPADLVATLMDPGGLAKKTILDSQGRSNFLQLLATVDRKIDFGSTSINWPGGSAANVEIKHGLGVVPVAVLAINSSAPAFWGVIVDVGVKTKEKFLTSLAFASEEGPVVGSKLTLDWIAIG